MPWGETKTISTLAPILEWAPSKYMVQTTSWPSFSSGTTEFA
jgi:hypothetical protein